MASLQEACAKICEEHSRACSTSGSRRRVYEDGPEGDSFLERRNQCLPLLHEPERLLVLLQGSTDTLHALVQEHNDHFRQHHTPQAFQPLDVTQDTLKLLCLKR
jgi:hypothetical protein